MANLIEVSTGTGIVEVQAETVVGAITDAEVEDIVDDVLASAKYALRLPGSGGHVNHGPFWTPGTAPNQSLGTEMFWEAWLKPREHSLGYIVVDGYGGNHALAWGLDSGVQTGNVWNGAAISFAGSYQIAIGEWAHVAVSLREGNLWTYVNGILDSITSFSGNRRLPGDSGAGVLWIGGSDHLWLYGDIAFVRGHDQYSPFTSAQHRSAAFIPPRFAFPNSSGDQTADRYPDFVCDYTRPGGTIIPDLSPKGYSFDAIQRWHHGCIGNANTNIGSAGAAGNENVLSGHIVQSPVPTWVRDDTCPFGQLIGSSLPTEVIPSIGSVPGGAKIFDSFGRRNQTLAFQSVPTLGSTEGGSLGAKVWQNSGWGVLQGSAVWTGSGVNPNWVVNNSADMDVRVTRYKASGIGEDTGICFRVTDANNYWWFVCNDTVAVLGTVIAGVVTQKAAYTLSSFGVPTTWATLRAVTSGTTITLYANATLLATRTGETDLQSATGAGIVQHPGSVAFWTTAARFKNFTVF